MTPDEAMKYECFGIAEPALEALQAEVLRLRHVCWQIEDLCWEKLAAEGEHGDEHLEARLNISLHSVMIRVDPDGEIFQKPYKIQPKALEVERLRAENETSGLAYRNLFANFQRLEAENAELRAHDAQLAAWFTEDKAETELLDAENQALKARLEWFERRQVFFDKLTETVDKNPSNPSYLHAILEGLRLWDSENSKPDGV